jgi:hypothetical protein
MYVAIEYSENESKENVTHKSSFLLLPVIQTKLNGTHEKLHKKCLKHERKLGQKIEMV